MTQQRIKSCWIVTEGIAGTENQCRGVAAALGVSATIKRIKLRQPWATLSPYLKFECIYSFSGDSPLPDDGKNGTWPDLVLAGGRKSIAVCRFVKRHAPNTKIVFFQDPRINETCFDLITAPLHDQLEGHNIISTTGAPNRITENLLKQESHSFKQDIEKLKGKKLAVLLGGNSKHHRYTSACHQKITTSLLSLAKQGYSLMVTASRRTGEENINALKQSLQTALPGKDQLYFWDGDGENPYFAFLEAADFILVTEDSVSMTSEAATTGKPVYRLELEGGSPKINRFHSLLDEKGITRPFDGKLETYSYPPLKDSQAVADEILIRFF